MLLHHQSRGVAAPSSTLALRYLRMSANQGDADALCALGDLHEAGSGDVLASDEEAAHYFRQAAAAGLPSAQYRLALMYEAGRGVERDAKAARRLYELAARAEYPDAIKKLEGMVLPRRPGGEAAQSPER